MLHEEVGLYRKLSGDMSENTPISRIGGYLDGYEKGLSVIEDIKAELWMEGMNMTGEYQGVWVRYRDIERVIDKHISGKEQKL